MIHQNVYLCTVYLHCTYHNMTQYNRICSITIILLYRYLQLFLQINLRTSNDLTPDSVMGTRLNRVHFFNNPIEHRKEYSHILVKLFQFSGGPSKTCRVSVLCIIHEIIVYLERVDIDIKRADSAELRTR